MEHGNLPVLRELVVLLIAMGIIVPLVRRLKASTVLGYLLVGVFIGPWGLGALAEHVPALKWFTIQNTGTIRTLAELGVVFLLFMIGLDLSLERLMSMARLVFGLGVAQVVATAVIMAWVLHATLGLTAQQAVIIGAGLALSSTAIVMHLLVEERRLATPVGRSAFAILLFQDLAVVPILFLVGALAIDGKEGLFASLLFNVGKAAVAIAVILGLGRLLVRPLLHFVAATRNRETFMAAVLLLVIGTGVFTHMAGLSMVLGAFMAGLLLAETEYAQQVEVDLAPFKGLLMGVFFTSIGMSLDLPAAFALWDVLLVAVVVLAVLKTAVLLVLGRLFGLGWSTSLETGLLLAHGGEFAFVIYSQAMGLNVLSEPLGQFFMVVATISMFLLPFMARLARLAGERLTHAEMRRCTPMPTERETGELKNHVIIAGYGRVGRLLGEILGEMRMPFVAIDNDPVIVATGRREAPLYFGNAAQVDVLRRLGAERAHSLVVTMDDADEAEGVVSAAHLQWPHLLILARARDTRHAMQLVRQGAHDVVPETVEASLDLGELLLQHAGMSPDAARKIIADRRRRERLHLMRAVRRGRCEPDDSHTDDEGKPEV